MTLQERIEWATKKVEEACKQNEDTATIRYWVGYRDGIIAVRDRKDV